ncbi:hypothetical protein RFI_24625 [Reticulomyxa filosa]|uniref:Uncharacterized protein n=1 Tax=Reticulomyxa filosa TaxID=46433 RepID=X6MI64_RETFI|nr:hypothetical protein RFI_24625 [Reticulomyxa filosa]|eukprot:ETO12750.1 hypothetical protein RFI_24625 [Reticulomyxa filosa]
MEILTKHLLFFAQNTTIAPVLLFVFVLCLCLFVKKKEIQISLKKLKKKKKEMLMKDEEMKTEQHDVDDEKTNKTIQDENQSFSSAYEHCPNKERKIKTVVN